MAGGSRADDWPEREGSIDIPESYGKRVAVRGITFLHVTSLRDLQL